MKDLVGCRYGKLVVLQDLGKLHLPDQHRSFKCQCDCGNTVDVCHSNLVRKNITDSRSCGKCCRSEISRKAYRIRRERQGPNYRSPNWKGHGLVSGDIIATCRSSARNRNIEFAITAEDIWEIYQHQEGRCALTGRSIVFRNKDSRGDASIDRIDSSIGYLKTNIQIVHKDVNLMKNHFEQNYFIQTCCEISNTFKISNGGQT